MKKKLNYGLLSNRRCKDCGKPLKQELIRRNNDADRCYVCHQVSKGIFTMVLNKKQYSQDYYIKTIDFKHKQKQQRKKYKWITQKH
jgi:hypothetical protein